MKKSILAVGAFALLFAAPTFAQEPEKPVKPIQSVKAVSSKPVKISDAKIKEIEKLNKVETKNSEVEKERPEPSIVDPNLDIPEVPNEPAKEIRSQPVQTVKMKKLAEPRQIARPIEDN